MEDAGVRGLLSADRESTLTRIGAMISDFEEIVAATEGANSDDEHDPEGSTIAFERAQIAALLLEARTHLDDLDRALARLDAGDYATCEQCGTPIPPERLAARPATRTCIECATARSGSSETESSPGRPDVPARRHREPATGWRRARAE